jgi:hypothetical protein
VKEHCKVLREKDCVPDDYELEVVCTMSFIEEEVRPYFCMIL